MLLGDAVDAAAAGEELAGVDADYPAAGVGVAEDAQGFFVHRVAERAGDDAAVDHQMVDVAVVDEALLVPSGFPGRGPR